MAGTPANMTIAPYKDGTVTNDHTYYGRGCKNSWGTSGEEGSQTPCADSDAGGRYVKTADNETQKNGTYYNFQAATVGAGGAMATDKTDSSYTFCPLGWQLPYSGTGGDYYDKSRSWKYLFSKYSLIDDQASATKLKSYLFSYVYSGYYRWGTGRLYYQNNGGYYWSSTVVSSTHAYYLNTWSSAVRPAVTDNKAYGFTVRCVHTSATPCQNLRHSEIESKLSFLHFLGSSTARWKERKFTVARFTLKPQQLITEMDVQIHGILLSLSMAARLHRAQQE